MEIQLQELIDQIKQDGVAAAKAEADKILTDAKAEAQKILEDAQRKADELLERTKSENEKTVHAGEEAIRQAGRNLLISFRESVTRELTALLGEATASAYSAQALTDAIAATVEAWAKNPEAESLEVLLNGQELAQLEDCLLGALKGRVEKGVTLKASDRFVGGFRIALNQDGIYYDYSADAVTQMLSNYLSPKVSKLLKEAT